MPAETLVNAKTMGYESLNISIGDFLTMLTKAGVRALTIPREPRPQNEMIEIIDSDGWYSAYYKIGTIVYQHNTYVVCSCSQEDYVDEDLVFFKVVSANHRSGTLVRVLDKELITELTKAFKEGEKVQKTMQRIFCVVFCGKYVK